jgi:hypothetical protein
MLSHFQAFPGFVLVLLAGTFFVPVCPALGSFLPSFLL